MEKFQIFSIQVDLHAGGDQDKFPFVALVTYGGKVSDGLVGGTENIEGGPYRVFIPGKTLDSRIGELAGKSVLASEDLSSHTDNESIGTFLQAWTEPGRDPKTGEYITVAKASGVFDRSRNPELVDRVIALARQGKAGFSYDIKEVRVGLMAVSSGEQVVRAEDFKWRGATVLHRDAAAYESTRLAASKLQDKEEKVDEKKLAELVSNQIKEGFKTFTAEFKAEQVDPLVAKIEAVEGSIGEVTTKLDTLEAANEVIRADLEAGKKKGKKGRSDNSDDGDSGDSKGQVVPFNKFFENLGAQIASAVEEGIKPVAEKLEGIQEKIEASTGSTDAEPRTRTSIGDKADSLVAKFVEGHDPQKGTSSRDIEAAIAVVKQTVENKKQRTAALDTLSSARRRAIKQERKASHG